MERIARCSCGQLQVRCSGDPLKVSACHCIECQRRTGSAFGVAAFFSSEAVLINGSSKQFVRTGDSGHPVTLHFCPECGSTVFWYPARRPGHVAVAIGSFGDTEFPPPVQEVYQHHRHAWARLDLAES